MCSETRDCTQHDTVSCEILSELQHLNCISFSQILHSASWQEAQPENEERDRKTHLHLNMYYIRI